MDPNKERKQLLHRWAGPMARADTDTDTDPSRALKTRGLQWWRHPNKDGKSSNTKVNIGWLQIPQKMKNKEQEFGKTTAAAAAACKKQNENQKESSSNIPGHTRRFFG